jgi:putative flippase GtrA
LGRLDELARRHGALSLVKFGVAGIVGFLVAEAIVVAGLFLIYGSFEVPRGVSTSPSLIAVDVIAFVVGVTVGFFVNEWTTVRGVQDRGSGVRKDTFVRLVKYQGVYVIGNGITIGTQLFLLAVLALSPAIGVLVGAVVAYPVSYEISMRVVWKA